MDLATMLAWTAERYPNRRAVGGREPMSFAQWNSRVNQLAHVLMDLGVSRGDRVALALTGGEPLASLHLAAQKIGAVSVPLSTRFGKDEMAYCLVDCQPTLLISDESSRDRVPDDVWCSYRDIAEVRAAAAEASDSEPRYRPADSDLSVMLYTSGTTGRPKGVPRTHGAEHAAAVAHLLQTQLRAGDVTLGVMPMFHTMGLRTLIASIVVGGTWVAQERFDAEESLELIQAEGVSALYLVPTIYWSLVQTGRFDQMASVSRLAYAGAPMTPKLTEDLVAQLNPDVFVNHFGSTEIYTFTIAGNAAAKPGCAGRPGVFSRVRLVSPEPGAMPDDLVAAGEQGQVIVSMNSPEAFAGYWQRPDADERAIRAGWYFTGDLATEDEDGDLWVAGRVDDMINSGGENIYPDEIEAVLSRSAAVRDVCVVGLPDERWGSAVTAFVVPARGYAVGQAVAEVKAFAREALPALKRPKEVLPIEEIPKSAVGKILRRKLVEGDYTGLPVTDGGRPNV